MPASLRALFCSYHGYFDPSSGAAVSLRELFALLRRCGWHCRALCGPQMDFENARTVDSVLAEQKLEILSRRCSAGPSPFRVHRLVLDHVPLTIYEPDQSGEDLESLYPFIALLDRAICRWKPDLLITFGGGWRGRSVIACAKQRGAKVVFWLRNCDYQQAGFFAPVDSILVPSRFTREYYESRLGLRSTDIPSPVLRSRVVCEATDRRYLTFINPQLAKGVLVFASIAKELNRLRPDIPLLVVEGRAGSSWLSRAGIDPGRMANLHVMPAAYDPRDFYRLTRVLLVPSLWEETFARVSVEALLNGIPVLASRRGGLPESLAHAGFLFDVPERYTARSTDVPSAGEVSSWVETIIRLWDDPDFYATECARSRNAADAFSEERLMHRYNQHLRSVVHRVTEPLDRDEEPVLETLRAGMPTSGEHCGELTSAVLDDLLEAFPASI